MRHEVDLSSGGAGPGLCWVVWCAGPNAQVVERAIRTAIPDFLHYHLEHKRVVFIYSAVSQLLVDVLHVMFL